NGDFDVSVRPVVGRFPPLLYQIPGWSFHKPGPDFLQLIANGIDNPVNTAAELIGLNFDGARLIDRNLPEDQQGQNSTGSAPQPSTTPNYAIQLGAELNLPIDLAALDFGQGQFDIPLGEIHQITHNWAYLDPANVELSFSYRVKTAADLEVLHVFY